MSPRRLVALALAALVLDLVLIQPNHPAAMTIGALKLVPLELPAILLGLVALGDGGAGRLARRGLALVLVAIVVLKIADFGTFTAFGRGFDPIVDLNLLPAGLNLLSGTVGLLPVLAGGVAILVALAALVFVLSRAMRTWARLGPLAGRPGRRAAGGLAVVMAAVCVAETGLLMGAWALPANPPGAAFTTRVAAEHLRDYARSRAAFAQFATAAAEDPFAGREGLFDRLEGRDVVVIFVESYGRSSFDNPLYAPTHQATLRAAEPALTAAGLGARSGWLTSPVEGGLSWLAHATLASGLRVGDQRRYRALLASPRQSLWHLAADRGFATAAIAPAIVMPWPEAPMLGFQQVLAAADLGYRGQPFNWITMPDQYVLSAFPARLDRGERPLFAEIALISSHAPWVPVPEMVPWDAVGDGRIFDRWATSGDPPEVVWRDPDRVRDQYRQAIDYALQAVTGWAAQPRADQPLLIVLGDHQPAGFVAGIGSRDVPVHLIGPPEVLALFDDWQWTDGLLPADDLPAWPMEAFRDRFVAATTDAPVDAAPDAVPDAGSGEVGQ